jgi:RimJ/RimL family protein N-acetyltransferase
LSLATLKYVFYVRERHDQTVPDTPDMGRNYRYGLWRPARNHLYPPGMRGLPFIVWWVMHYLGIFANRDYSIFVAYDSSLLIHRSVVFPRYFRFPFMTDSDLQIGDTWTHPEYRRQGLAAYAMLKILETHHAPGRRFWYVVEEDNVPSIKVIEKAGFIKHGYGRRGRRAGLRILGTFDLETVCQGSL